MDTLRRLTDRIRAKNRITNIETCLWRAGVPPPLGADPIDPAFRVRRYTIKHQLAVPVLDFRPHGRAHDGYEVPLGEGIVVRDMLNSQGDTKDVYIIGHELARFECEGMLEHPTLGRGFCEALLARL